MTFYIDNAFIHEQALHINSVKLKIKFAIKIVIAK